MTHSNDHVKDDEVNVTLLCIHQVVQYLLNHVDKKSVYLALMLAINLGHDEIAEMIIGKALHISFKPGLLYISVISV